MIGALVFLLIILVILAIFIGKNVHHTCSMWLFHEFSDLSTVSVIMIAFAAGIVFTMLCFFISYLIKSDKKKFAKKGKNEETAKSEGVASGKSGLFSRGTAGTTGTSAGNAGTSAGAASGDIKPKKSFFKFGRNKKKADVNKSSENSDITVRDVL